MTGAHLHATGGFVGAVLAALCLFGVPHAIAGQCDNMQPGTFTLRAKLKLPLLKSATGVAAILIRSQVDGKDDQLNVNSDGSPRAYHLLDPEGRKYALNDMYSGATRVFENGTEISPGESDITPDERRERLRRYYEVFGRFVAENGNFGVSESKYDPSKDPAYKVGGDFGNGLDPPKRLDTSLFTSSISSLSEWIFGPAAKPPVPSVARRTEDLGNDYVCLQCSATNCNVCFNKWIIALDGKKLCIRKTGRYSGFLVNRTAIDGDAGNAADPENAEDKTCSIASNLDPEKLPGFVLPSGKLPVDGDATLVAHEGDVVVGFNPKKGKWVFGIVSDGGPRGKFGEASIAFGRTLSLGYAAGAGYPRPPAYHQGLLGSVFQPDRPIPLLFLPGSKAKFKLPAPVDGKEYDFAPSTVARVGKASFLEWAGTTDIEQARTWFKDCLGSLHAQPLVEE